MNLKKILTVDAVLPDLQASTKRGVIEEMISALAAGNMLTEQSSALQAVLDREEKMSTGMQNGIAIPHGKTDAVDQLVAAVGIHRKGVDFESMDGKPAHILIMTLSPENRSGPHIQFLAEISKVLSRPDFRDRLLETQTAAEAYSVLTA